MKRRTLILGSSVLVAAMSAAWSQPAAWPERPIKLIVPYAPGGGTDLIARTVANKLSARLGQQLVVDNRGGAGGALGFEAGIKAPPDGYTLLFVTGAYSTVAATGKKLPYDPVRDIAPIGRIGTTPLLIAVSNTLPAKTLGEFVDMARAKPGALTYGSGGVGAMSHLGMELFAAESKIQMTHIPYKGMAPAFNDLIAGHLQAGLATFATAKGLMDTGKLRALAVTGVTRSPFAPQVPTTAEAGFPNAAIEFWWGLVAPAKVPPQILKRLNTELNGILAQPEMTEALAGEGAVPAPMSAEGFGKMIGEDISRWRRLVKERNIQLD